MPQVTNKWKTLLLVPDDDSYWNKIFILPKKKILHRILATNKKLLQYKIKISPLCNCSGIEEESIQHLFCECNLATSIWLEFEVAEWQNIRGRNIEYLSDSHIFSGDPDLDPVINRIIVMTKKAILKNRGKRPPTLSQIIALLRSQFRIEKFNEENLVKPGSSEVSGHRSGTESIKDKDRRHLHDTYSHPPSKISRNRKQPPPPPPCRYECFSLSFHKLCVI